MTPRQWLMAQLDHKGRILATRICDELDRMSLPSNWITISEWTIVDSLRTLGAI